MEAVIVNFRQGRHTIYSSEMILKVKDIDKKENHLRAYKPLSNTRKP